MKCSRRELGLLLPILASAQQTKGLPSKVFKYDDLPVKANGENKSRAVLRVLAQPALASIPWLELVKLREARNAAVRPFCAARPG